MLRCHRQEDEDNSTFSVGGVLLIDKDMKKKDLCAKADISHAIVTKIGKNGHVTTEILLKICTAFDCQIADIMEFIPEDE